MSKRSQRTDSAVAECPAGSAERRRGAVEPIVPIRVPCLGAQTPKVVVGAMLLAIALFVVARQKETSAVRAEFVGAAGGIAAAITEAVDDNLESLDRVATFFTASEQVSRDEFRRFACGILAEAPSIHALEWIPRVARAQKQAMEGTARGEGLRDYRVTEYGPSAGLVPVGDRSFYYPVLYVEPLAGNQRALGFDLASEPVRRAALERACDTGRQSATEPIVLVQEAESQLGCLVFLPIYRSEAPPLTPEERRASLHGFLVCVLRLGDLLGAAFDDGRQEGIELSVSDGSAAPRPVTLFRTGPARALRAAYPRWSTAVRLADRAWTLDFTAGASYRARGRSAQPWLLLGGGLLVAASIHCQYRARGSYTAEIDKARRRLEATVSDLESARDEALLFDRITEQVNSGLSLVEVLEQTFEALRQIIPYDRIGFSLVDAEGATVRSLWAKSRLGPMAFPDGYAAPLAGSSLERVALTGEPRILNDLEAYLADHPESASTRMILQEGMRSSLTCPLIARGKTIGFLFFSSIEAHKYQPGHIRTFMRVARRLSAIADKARLHDELLHERQRSETLLYNVLPRRVADRLKSDTTCVAETFDEATVLFADLVSFCKWSADLAPESLVSSLNKVFSRFDQIARRHGVEKISTVGDAYLAVCGMPVHREDHAAAMAHFALALNEAIGEFRLPGCEALSLRIGIHTGPVVAGVVGQRTFRYDVWGPTVNLASRLQSAADPGQILVSRQTRDRLDGVFALADHGQLEVKGLGSHRAYALLGPTGPGIFEEPAPDGAREACIRAAQP